MRAEDEEALLRSVALQNAQSILRARERAEQELLAAKEALRETAERLRAVFDQAAVGIAVADLEGRFLEANSRCARILGYAPGEMPGLTIQGITHPDDLEAMREKMADLLAGRCADYTLENRYLRNDGAVLWSRTAVTSLNGPDGRARQLIGVIEDITERKQLMESERAARAEAERASAMKDEFLATLSHELRTPLSAILGWSQVLRFRTMSESERQQGLETIERNARMQTQLIEDLLDMSRITSGKLRLDIQAVAPAIFIEAAIETVRPAADAKGILLQTLLDPAAGPISGDPHRLQQVVWNLLSNAIKFTPRGGKVHVMLQRVNSHIELSVTDTGVGIPSEFLPFVFERFRQADASTTRVHGGLGLGLSIVKRLVELHGGSVRVVSAGEESGATFTVSLPLIAVHTHDHAAERLHPAASTSTATDFRHSDLSGVKVLVVDDEEDARELIRRVLTDCAAEVLTAGSAHEALAMIEKEKPHVLVSDIGMPELDGYELLRRVRALGHSGRLPAIALTAFARSEDRTRALRAGFLVHVSKPIEPSELVATVASVMGRAGV